MTGKVQNDSGAPVAAMDAIAGKSWFELSAGARLAVRHGPSSREFELVGPGRALPCRDGLEQVLLAEGQFASSPGAGVRPGAEMWVVTPFGALRYGDAALTLHVDKAALALRLASGRVATEAEAGNAPRSFLGPIPEKRLTKATATAERVRRCETAAKEARSLADQLLGASRELGKLAAQQMESRRRARAECLVAEAALDRVKDAAEKTRLSDQLTAANQLWQAVPAMVR